MLNIDDLGSYSEGVAYIIDDDKNVPQTGVRIRTLKKDRKVTLRPYQHSDLPI